MSGDEYISFRSVVFLFYSLMKYFFRFRFFLDFVVLLIVVCNPRIFELQEEFVKRLEFFFGFFLCSKFIAVLHGCISSHRWYSIHIPDWNVKNSRKITFWKWKSWWCIHCTKWIFFCWFFIKSVGAQSAIEATLHCMPRPLLFIFMVSGPMKFFFLLFHSSLICI